jgi:hypothetical protein
VQIILGAALIVAGITLAGVGTLSVAAHAGQAGDHDALAMFGEMMPVFTSPRCANCHGGTNPVSGLNHEPGPVADSTRLSNGDMGFDEQKVCQECHTAGTANWRTAPSSMRFVGKDTLTLCRQMRRTFGGLGGNDAADSRAAFVFHLATDDLIGVGFVGQGGIGEDSPFATIEPAPPPMSRAEMVAAAQTWVDVGHANCGPNAWNGTITSTTAGKSHEDKQRGTLLVKDFATELKVKLTVVDGTATADVSFAMHDFTDQQPNRPCWVIHDSWVAEGKGDADFQVLGDPTESGNMLLTWYVPAYKGNHHSEMRTVPPACKAVLRDEPYSAQKSFKSVKPTVDPNDPNHLAGQSIVDNPNDKTTTTIKWDLTREP